SAGQRRRAALARLDLEGWPVALLDEPFGELDTDAAALLRTRIGEKVARRATVLVATHGHAELDASARVLHLSGGALAA
ncbi:MAG: cytochrome c biogenesis heme-transporting ATPase CcmA, partial [Candidatus Limnocylindria bacterium]